MDPLTRVQNREGIAYVSLFADAFEKGLDSSLFSYRYGLIARQTGLFGFRTATSLGEGKL